MHNSAPVYLMRDVCPDAVSTRGLESIRFDECSFIHITINDIYVAVSDTFEQGRLRVHTGDVTYVKYEDLTLPKPYAAADCMNTIARTPVDNSGCHITTVVLICMLLYLNEVVI